MSDYIHSSVVVESAISEENNRDTNEREESINNMTKDDAEGGGYLAGDEAESETMSAAINSSMSEESGDQKKLCQVSQICSFIAIVSTAAHVQQEC